MNKDFIIYRLIGLVSSLIIGFLIWLIYFKTGPMVAGSLWVNHLPTLNALLNGITATLLIAGIVYIKKNNIQRHRWLMGLATLSSGLFLLSYITYHHYHGDTKFIGTGAMKIAYFSVLISHVLLSVVQVPLILATLYLAYSQKFCQHAKLARITFPVWLYVSLTGVFIFFMLKWFNY